MLLDGVMLSANDAVLTARVVVLVAKAVMLDEDDIALISRFTSLTN